MLGIKIVGFQSKLVIDSPVMPDWLDRLKIENLRIAEGAVCLLVRRAPEGASIGIIGTRGDVTVQALM
jgi:hypothetical protein